MNEKKASRIKKLFIFLLFILPLFSFLLVSRGIVKFSKKIIIERLGTGEAKAACWQPGGDCSVDCGDGACVDCTADCDVDCDCDCDCESGDCDCDCD